MILQKEKVNVTFNTGDYHLFKPKIYEIRGNLIYMVEKISCTKCQEEKDADNFHFSTNSRGYSYWCKQCRSKYDLGKRAKLPVCLSCKLHKRVDSNKICVKCNENMGLKECNKCHNLLLLIYFFKYKYSCKDCMKAWREEKLGF